MIENVTRFKSEIALNVSMNKTPKEYNLYEKDYTWNPATCTFENGKKLAGIIDESVFTCNELLCDFRKAHSTQHALFKTSSEMTERVTLVWNCRNDSKGFISSL